MKSRRKKNYVSAQDTCEIHNLYTNTIDGDHFLNKNRDQCLNAEENGAAEDSHLAFSADYKFGNTNMYNNCLLPAVNHFAGLNRFSSNAMLLQALSK